MEGGDTYKSLLASASHAQQQRHARLQTSEKGHAVGNVFLPAIQKRSSVQSALSMKHLQIIEQCILAENRREEQLAKCQTDKERRYLSKKFIAQRHHERDLIHALMLGQPSGAELHVEDVTTEAYQSPLLAGARSPRSRKSSSSASPDKLIKMAGERTFATTSPSKRQPTKAVSPHFHGTASPERRSLTEQDAWLSEESSSSSPSKKRSPSAVKAGTERVRPARSASPTHKSSSSPSVSPTRHRPTAAAKDRSKLPYALATSPLKAKAASPSPVSSPSKARKAKVRSNGPSETHHDDSVEATTEFEGATSFLEARKHVMSLGHGQQGVAECETQTTERFRRDYPADGESRQKYVLMLMKEDDKMPVEGGLRQRPHSSPEPRRRRPSAESPLLPSLSSSHSDAALRRVELFHATESSPLKAGCVATFISDDHTKTIQMYHKDNLGEMAGQQLAWTEPSTKSTSPPKTTATEEVVEEPSEQLTRDESTDEIDWDELERRVRADMGVQPEEAGRSGASEVEVAHEGDAATTDDVAEQEVSISAAVEEEMDTTTGGESPIVDDDDRDHDTHSLLLSMLYDVIHEIEETHSQEQSIAAKPVVAASSREVVQSSSGTSRRSLVDFARYVTLIQSAFRGYRARKVFRQALYQEALQCGVLGAMPGTIQGHSGWYQDPKSFMAYYFVVQEDGEWTQKNVLRCTGLVLTPYQMHAQIWTRTQPAK